MHSTSQIELSKSALATNISFIREMLGETKLSAVVKGNAYGHGLELFSQMLYETGVRHYSVFSAKEAERVLACLPKDITVMVMGYVGDDQIEWVIENNVEYFVFENGRLEKSIEVAREMKKTALVHIEVETGMNRTGFENKSLKRVFQVLEQAQRHIKVKGVCSHLAGAESIVNHTRVEAQVQRFKKVQQALKKLPWLDTQYHLACSAASIQYPETQMDMARIGILQYGFFPTNEVLVQYLTRHKITENPLKRVVSWKTRVMDIKHVGKGEYVGYGTSFFTNIPTKVAVLPIGYAHGFSRSLSNVGKVLIRAQRFDVIGTVNMNMIMVDITESENIEKGDEVVIVGRQGDLEISVSSFGEFSDMVNYELLTRLPTSIERRVVD
jgi:alanine racemase